jgi:ArsR family transcriptional regulator, arsenate/arsenite/antimonite-responsive transcriptional repressor
MDDTGAIDALSALAHPTRLRVFRHLVRAGVQGLPAGEIARQLDVPATTMSTHLGILARAGVIAARRESRIVFYALDVDGTRAVFAYLLQDCCGGRPDLCAPLTLAAEAPCP